jgi:hypothetical protein
MKYEEKIEKWLQFAKAKGMSDKLARPPIDRTISALGFQLPPMLFWSFPSVTALMGSAFGIFSGIFMYFTAWSERPVLNTVFASIAVGIPFGICMAAIQVWQKRKWRLPPWETFSKD